MGLVFDVAVFSHQSSSKILDDGPSASRLSQILFYPFLLDSLLQREACFVHLFVGLKLSEDVLHLKM